MLPAFDEHAGYPAVEWNASLLRHNEIKWAPAGTSRMGTLLCRRIPLRLIALDLDGTLLTRGKTLSARTQGALILLAERGCHVVVATGRPFEVMALFCRDLPLTAPQIALNGAAIHDPVAGRVLRLRPMATEDVERAAAFFRERDIPMALFTTDGLYLDTRIPNRHLWHPPPLPPPRDLASLGRFRHHKILKVVAHAEPHSVDLLHPSAVEALGDHLYITRTAPTLVEALDHTVSKGQALQHVAGLLDVPREEIVAFGDHDNDLPMFAVAGVSVAMGNAAPEVKAAADLTTLSNEEDGIAAVLEQLEPLTKVVDTRMRSSPHQPSRLCRVIADHQMSYPDPLVVFAGEEVTVGERDTRWPYIWCVNGDGKGGWVPVSYVYLDGENRGRALQEFDTTELTVHAGEVVTVAREEGGWLWCTNQRGQSGWVPKDNVD